MLKKDDFDFYYLIICSRGPGSETIVVDNVSDRRDAIHFYEASEAQFRKIGACEAGADFNDEGPIIAVPKGTKPLKAIYEWIKQDVANLEAENGADFFTSSRLFGIMQKIEKEMVEHGVDSEQAEEARKLTDKFADDRPPVSYRQAYISACLRAFLASKLGEEGNPWTSINGWRNVEVEIPNKSQFEVLMEATGETAEQLVGQWACAVLKEAAKRYLERKLPEREFPGC